MSCPYPLPYISSPLVGFARLRWYYYQHQNPVSSSFTPSLSSFSRRNYRSMAPHSALGFTLQYPTARRDDSVVEDYHGVKIADPYRWLEDPDSEETKKFVEEQVKLTDSVLKECDLRDKIRDKITLLFDHPRYSAPFKRADKYFYTHNSGLQPQSVLYVQDSLDGEAEVLLDPNGLSKDGTVALSTYEISEDAKYFAYGLSSSGSDWVTIKVLNIEDKKDEPETLSWVKFSGITWTHDNKGFFYSRYPAPKEGENIDAGTETNSNLYHQLYYHFLGTDQSEDVLCWKDDDNPKYSFGASVTDDGKYVLLCTNEGCDPVNKLYYCDISAFPEGLEGFRKGKGLLPFTKLVDTFEAQYHEVANDDTVFTFLTNKDAPKYKLVRVDLKEPNSWVDILPESEKDVLESASAVNGDQMIVSYMSDVKYVIQVRDLKTGSLLHQLPINIGTVDGISARRKDSTAFFSFTSFLTPGIIYQCHLDKEVPELKIFREINVPGFDRTDFTVEQVFVPSKDGVKIPSFIVARKNIKLDGSHPCLLYGYGGFNISLTPSFSVSRTILTRNLGTVMCIANIRGGGEYGEEWHKAGALAKKQNCFDDFISTAEYLISSGYTQPKKLCIEGGSNGGLLIGACINQRPDLFGCALAHVGVMDMLRFHKFTIGHAWTSDYGCSDKEKEFHWLIKYSPLHNVRRPWEQHPDQACQYPPTMLLTADHDDRVVPLHSLKLLATMQYTLCTSLENSPQTNPIIGRIECKAGHGAGRPTQKMIDEAADQYAFMAKMEANESPKTKCFTIDGISARRKDSTAFFSFTSFLTPGIIYQCHLDKEVPELKIFREINVPGFDRTDFTVEQVFVPSKDGVKIPLFIVARKNIKLDGSHPCLLYGYGGFNFSLTPSFDVSLAILTRNLGTVMCIANIRGGGEYGEEWHKAGALAKKQNCFDDFISTAEYLISTGYTQPKKLCIEGASNGGLLIGACINQRPDLFGCALAHVGVMDMLRFHKFTIGHAWTSDYGCSDKEEEFHWLIKYSPLHNVRRPWEQHPDQACQYPPTILLTADHDDRVVPLHSLKLLATMQYTLCTSLENSPQTNPIIGRIECKAGHGVGRPTQKMIDEAADRYAFMAKMVGASWIE